jgi:hypothetical protein
LRQEVNTHGVFLINFRAISCTDWSSPECLLQVDALNNEEQVAVLQQPQDDAQTSNNAAIGDAGDMSRSQLPGFTAAPLLRRAGHSEPDSHDGSHSGAANSMAVSVSVTASASQQQDEVTAGAAMLRGGSGTGSGSRRHGISGHHPDLTELQAQVRRTSSTAPW